MTRFFTANGLRAPWNDGRIVAPYSQPIATKRGNDYALPGDHQTINSPAATTSPTSPPTIPPTTPLVTATNMCPAGQSYPDSKF